MFEGIPLDLGTTTGVVSTPKLGGGGGGGVEACPIVFRLSQMVGGGFGGELVLQ